MAGRVEKRRARLLTDEVVYLWVNGICVKAGLENEKAFLLGAIGSLRDGQEVVLSLESRYRESKEPWATLLRSLRDWGMNAPKAAIGDRHPGIWGALTMATRFFEG